MHGCVVTKTNWHYSSGVVPRFNITVPTQPLSSLSVLSGIKCSVIIYIIAAPLSHSIASICFPPALPGKTKASLAQSKVSGGEGFN